MHDAASTHNTHHTTQKEQRACHRTDMQLRAEVIVQTSGLCDVVVANLVRMLGSGEDVVSMEASQSEESLVGLPRA